MFRKHDPESIETRQLLFFGITEALTGILVPALGSGLGAAVAGGLTDAAIGAGGGAALAGLTGGKPGLGALTGGISGGAVGALGPAIGSALGGATGLSAGTAATIGDVAAGAGGGLVGAEVTGQNPLSGALTGGAGGLAAGLSGIGGAGTTATPSPAASAVPAGGTAGAGASAASAALPGGGIAASGDLLGPSTTLPSAGGGAYGSYGLTSVGAPQDVGAGAIGGGAGAGGAGGGSFDPAAAAASGATLPPGSADQDFSGGGGGGLLSKIGGFAANNPGAVASAGILGLEALKQNQPLPEQAQLNTIGAQTAAEGNQLASYVSSGTLPPGAQESINLATTAAKSQVRSTAAQLGLSGSTWEADRMAQVDQQASAQGEQIAQQLLQQGANYTQLSSGVFEQLLKSTLDQDTAFQKSLSQFAAGLAGAKLNTGTS